MTYQDYLKSEHWSLLRGAKLQISSKSEMCRSKEELEVHHKCYRASWYDAKLADLQTLCHHCHIMEHAKEWRKTPVQQEHQPASCRKANLRLANVLKRRIDKMVAEGKGDTPRCHARRKNLLWTVRKHAPERMAEYGLL